MRPDEIREMSDADIRGRIAELEEERFRLKFRSATEALEEPLRFRTIRRDVARLKTILRERELAAQRGADAKSAVPGAGRTAPGAPGDGAAKSGKAGKAGEAERSGKAGKSARARRSGETGDTGDTDTAAADAAKVGAKRATRRGSAKE
jgi:large subunit ribosomal protein L29